MQELSYGKSFRGVVTTTDASTPVQFTLYLNGETTAYTLKSNERVAITDALVVQTVSGASRLLVSSTDNAANLLGGGTCDTGFKLGPMKTPIVGAVAAAPYVKAPAGQVDAVIMGSVIPA